MKPKGPFGFMSSNFIGPENWHSNQVMMMINLSMASHNLLGLPTGKLDIVSNNHWLSPGKYISVLI